MREAKQTVDCQLLSKHFSEVYIGVKGRKSMEGRLYCGVVLSAKDSPDGESPTCYEVTQELNGIALWHSSYHGGLVCEEYRAYWNRDDAIELAVARTITDRKALTE